jgi:hypothetical protein
MPNWETVHILFSRADSATGAVVCQLGDVLSGEVMDGEAPMYTGIGLLNLAAAPIPGVAAAEAITFKSGNTDYVIGGRSVRSASIAGLIGMGESCIYADGSQACTLYKLDGRIVHFTTADNTATGQQVTAEHGPNGHSWITPWTRFINDSVGFHFLHTSGASFDLGYMGLSGPFSVLGDLGFNTYASLKAHMLRLDGEIVVIGSGSGAPDPAVKFNELAILLGTIGTALTALNTAIGSIVGAPSGPIGAAPALTASPFVDTATAAIANAINTIASRSVLIGS